MLPRCRALALLSLSLSFAACAADERAATAMQLVDEFQTALLAGDERRCRKLVTEASAQALASIPWDAVAKKKPVTVQGAEPLDSGYRIAVLDPNDGGRRAEFIVVREYGRLGSN